MKHLTALLLLLTLIGAPAAAQEAGAVSLRPQWSVGQTARYSVWSSMEKNETAELFGQVQSETTTYLTEGETLWVVESVNDDGSAACTMKMVKLKVTITAGDNEPVVIDSENPSGDIPVFDDLIAAMVSTPLTVRVNADGTIEAVEGVDELTAAAGQDAVDADAIPDELDFKETASELATLLAAPASATPGQTWNTKSTWNQDNVMPGAEAVADWDTTFTFASQGEIDGVPIATVTSESSIDIKVDLGALPEDAPDIDIQIDDAVGKGEILFDLSRHETVARNDSMSYTANITVAPPNPDLPPIQVTIAEQSQSQILRIAEQ